MTAQELKALITRKTELEGSLADAKRNVESCNRMVQKLRGEIEAIERRIRQSTDSKIVVSEHAMLRYCQRVMGISLDDLAERVLPSAMHDTAKELGNAVLPVNGSHMARIKNNVVTTVLIKEGDPS